MVVVTTGLERSNGRVIFMAKKPVQKYFSLEIGHN